MPQIHDFSDGYYLVNGMYVEPSDDVTAPSIQRRVHDLLHDEYYDDYRTPILFRHNETEYHFQIEPADGVRSDTVEMPASVIDEMDLTSVPSEQQFLMTKPGHARMIVDMANPDIGMG